jgi:hypothetical protein
MNGPFSGGRGREPSCKLTPALSSGFALPRHSVLVASSIRAGAMAESTRATSLRRGPQVLQDVRELVDRHFPLGGSCWARGVDVSEQLVAPPRWR